MKITCPNCKKKFEPSFVEDNYISKKNRYEYDPVTIEDESCFCPHCNLPVYRSEIDPNEESELQIRRSKEKKS